MSTTLRNKLAAVKELVRDAYKNGATIREIAEVHGVSAGTVRNTLIEMGERLRARGRRLKNEPEATDAALDEIIASKETANVIRESTL